MGAYDDWNDDNSDDYDNMGVHKSRSASHAYMQSQGYHLDDNPVPPADVDLYTMSGGKTIVKKIITKRLKKVDMGDYSYYDEE